MNLLRRFLVAIGLVVALATGDARAALDATSRSNNGNWTTNVSVYSWTHTTAGSDRLLTVAIAAYSTAGARTVSGVTYNGVALTKLHSITATVESQNQDFEVWYLVAPATGANTIQVTMSAATAFNQAVAISYTGIDQVTPIDSNAISQSLTAVDSMAPATTVVGSQATLVGFAWPRISPAGMTISGGFIRISSIDASAGGDSNGNVPTGSQFLTWTRTGASSWPGVSVFSINTTAAEPIPQLVSKMTNKAIIEAISINSSKDINKLVISQSLDLWVPKVTFSAVITSEINASLTEMAAATETLSIFPAGGGGGGAAGIFGNGEDGGNANYNGDGGYGGSADNFLVARQNTPGATGTTGTEWDGVVGSGAGGAGGSYNPGGNGMNGGNGGVYGGGGGGGGAGNGGSAGLGGTGGDGIVWIEYRSSSSGLYVTVVLTSASSSPWLVPADWTDVNKIALLGAGGCGADAGAFNGGNGGSGGNAVGGRNITGLTPGVTTIPFHVNTGAEACNVTVVQTTFHGGAAGSGVNGGGTGGGGNAAITDATISFTYYPGLGGPGGTLSGLEIIPNAGGLHPWQPLSHW